MVTLPWRPLYDTLLEAYTHGLRQPEHHATAIHAYRVSTLVSLAKKARRYPYTRARPRDDVREA